MPIGRRKSMSQENPGSRINHQTDKFRQQKRFGSIRPWKGWLNSGIWALQSTFHKSWDYWVWLFLQNTMGCKERVFCILCRKEKAIRPYRLDCKQHRCILCILIFGWKFSRCGLLDISNCGYWKLDLQNDAKVEYNRKGACRKTGNLHSFRINAVLGLSMLCKMPSDYLKCSYVHHVWRARQSYSNGNNIRNLQNNTMQILRLCLRESIGSLLKSRWVSSTNGLRKTNLQELVKTDDTSMYSVSK